MPQIVELAEPDAQREVIRLTLDEIATEVGTALRRAHLDFPVYLTVPNYGPSIATIATPLDPSDGDWSHASAIVAESSGNDWVTSGCAVGPYTAQWPMQQ